MPCAAPLFSAEPSIALQAASRVVDCRHEGSQRPHCPTAMMCLCPANGAPPVIGRESGHSSSGNVLGDSPIYVAGFNRRLAGGGLLRPNHSVETLLP